MVQGGRGLAMSDRRTTSQQQSTRRPRKLSFLLTWPSGQWTSVQMVAKSFCSEVGGRPAHHEPSDTKAHPRMVHTPAGGVAVVSVRSMASSTYLGCASGQAWHAVNARMNTPAGMRMNDSDDRAPRLSYLRRGNAKFERVRRDERASTVACTDIWMVEVI